MKFHAISASLHCYAAALLFNHGSYAPCARAGAVHRRQNRRADRQLLPLADLDAAHDWIWCHCWCDLFILNFEYTFLTLPGVGLIVTIVSFFQFSKLLSGNASPFALCYSIGNILSLGATMFLVGESVMHALLCVHAMLPTALLQGPVKQVKQMFAAKRWIATSV